MELQLNRKQLSLTFWPDALVIFRAKVIFTLTLKITRASDRNVGESCFLLSWSILIENPLVLSFWSQLRITAFNTSIILWGVHFPRECGRSVLYVSLHALQVFDTLMGSWCCCYSGVCFSPSLHSSLTGPVAPAPLERGPSHSITWLACE